MSYDNEDWDEYGAKYEAIFGICSRIMLSGGQKHHFLQDSVHISKFCAVYQILRKIPRAQNRRILEGLLNINIITCSKAQSYRAHAPKIDPSPSFHKITEA